MERWLRRRRCCVDRPTNILYIIYRDCNWPSWLADWIYLYIVLVSLVLDAKYPWRQCGRILLFFEWQFAIQLGAFQLACRPEASSRDSHWDEKRIKLQRPYTNRVANGEPFIQKLDFVVLILIIRHLFVSVQK